MTVATAQTGSEALKEIERGRPDLLLLDLGLPDMDGSDVLIRASQRLPVVVLSARAAVEDRIEGFRHGADDYVVKPFSPTEVVVRVQAVLARGRSRDGQGSGRTFGCGRMRIEPDRHEVHFDGRPISLTPSEWTLLAALSSHPHRVYPRHELVERLSGFAYEGFERAIDSHVKNLRHKLGDHDHVIVQTVVGFGYRFGLDRDGCG
jgi:DNA-binding response OmpR family regulator